MLQKTKLAIKESHNFSFDSYLPSLELDSEQLSVQVGLPGPREDEVAGEVPNLVAALGSVAAASSSEPEPGLQPVDVWRRLVLQHK